MGAPKRKNRHSRHPASVPARKTPAAKPAKRSRAAGAHAHAGAKELFGSAVAELLTTLASGDLLKAEVQTSVFASLALTADRLAGGSGKTARDFAASVIDSVTEDEYTPESAAFCRLLMSIGSPALKREASRALEEHTDEGIYPPDWVTEAGRAVPHQALRSYDIFGDEEYITITFGYGDAEHAIVVGLDMRLQPTVRVASVSPDAEELIKVIRDRDEPFERFEEITLAQARHRIEGPLARAGEDLDLDIGSSSLMCLPVVRARMRRLPTGSPGAAEEHVEEYTAADRAATVDDFLGSPLAESAEDTDAARFWAEVLTGYSGRIRGERPAQLGPGKLSAAILWHVARTFTLTDPQRGSLQPAVTAWTRWAAGRQGLDEAVTTYVLDHLQKVFDSFDSVYDNPELVTDRGYVRDLACRSDVDVAWLADCRASREFAVPLPADREDGRDILDAADPDHRVMIWTSEFGLCDTDDVPREEFVEAVKTVMEELWDGDPPATWQAAKRLRATGMSRHETIHTLARQAIANRGQA